MAGFLVPRTAHNQGKTPLLTHQQLLETGVHAFGVYLHVRYLRIQRPQKKRDTVLADQLQILPAPLLGGGEL